jgi:hypothetical protein
MARAAWILCFGLLGAGLSAAALAYPGTSDVEDFLTWAHVLLARGPLAGYAAIADYPPLGPFLLYVGIGAGRLAALPDLVSLKLEIAVFQLASAIIVAWRYRSLASGALLWILIAPFGALLGYIDCFYLPFVLLALFALEDRRFALGGGMIAVALLIKWQPAILAPLMLVHAMRLAPGWRKVSCVVPGAVIGLAVVLLFGPPAVWLAFSGAAGDPYFSGQAFNLDWIVSAFLEVFHLAGAPAPQGGTIVAITALAPPWYEISKILFWIVYLGVLGVFAIGKPRKLALALLTAELAQFDFNTGVHENHGFLVMSLAFVAACGGVLEGAYLGVIATAMLANILLFYGLNLIGGLAASGGTVLLSGLNLVVFIMLAARFLRGSAS